jgi:hypothetical protein
MSRLVPASGGFFNPTRIAVAASLGVALFVGAIALGVLVSSKPKATMVVASADPAMPATTNMAAIDPVAQARAARVEKVRAWAPSQRLAWLKHCLPTACDDDEFTDVVKGGVTPDELRSLSEIGFARAIALFAAGAADGSDLSATAIGNILKVYRTDPDVPVSLLPHTTRAAAMKDIVSHRGNFVAVAGTVLQVRREGDLFWSTMTADEGEPCYLITALDTEGVEVGGYARFEGAAVQRYGYANEVGGSVTSLVIVGRFSGKTRQLVTPLGN